jgi:hypothetical protein
MLRAVLASVAITLALPAVSQAAVTVGFDSPGGLLRITVTDAQSDVTLAAGMGGTTTVTATAAITPGAGCAVDGTGLIATCTPAGTSVTFTGGDGADILRVTTPFALPITATGGAGADQLSGGDGNDRLDTFDRTPDTGVSCGAGADILVADNFLDPLDFASCEAIAPEFAAGDPFILDQDPVPGATLHLMTAPSGTPLTLFVQWFSCDVTGDFTRCLEIPGATAPTLTLAAGDVGRTIRVGVVAQNAAGSDANVSAPTAVVHAPPAGAPAAAAPPRRATPTRISASRPAAFRARVAAARCGARACRLTIALSGPVRTARVDLRRGTRRLARVTRNVRGRRTLRVTLRTRRTLTRGAYEVRVRLTATDGRTRTFRRALRIL